MSFDWKNIYGESNAMKLIYKNNDVIFRTRNYLNIILFIFFMFFFLLLTGIFEYAMPKPFLLLYIFFAGAVSLTYRRVILLKKNRNKLIYYKTLLGLKFSREYVFQDIDRIILYTTKSPIIGVQLPLPIKKCSLDISFSSGKRIHVDKSSDSSVMKKYAEVISNITSTKIVES